MKKFCVKCNNSYYSKDCPSCGSSENLPNSSSDCEMCGKRGRLIRHKDKNNKETGYIPGVTKDMTLCYDCYHSFDKQKGFYVSDAKYHPEDIKAQHDSLEAQFFGDKELYCPPQRARDIKLGINKVYWDNWERNYNEKIANETMPDEWK
jgi:hypothetical protein